MTTRTRAGTVLLAPSVIVGLSLGAMRTLFDPETPLPSAVADSVELRPRPSGLVAATLRCDAACATVVGELEPATIRRLRQEALAMRARYARPVTIEARFVVSADALRLLASLEDLAAHGIRVESHPLAPLGGAAAGAGFAAPLAASAAAAAISAPPPVTPAPADATPPPPADATPPPPAEAPVAPAATFAPPRVATAADDPDPFGLDPAFRRSFLGPLRLLYDHYWRVEVSGLDHVPDGGGALIAANHSGAVPADAFMLAVALELRHPRRSLRVLYDRFVDALPVIGPMYRRLGAVSASLANAELLLQRGELVGLFPEGIAGVEKRYTERYRLRPFKTGTARLALRTGAPIVPVAIVGAEEAYPVVARLYRAGRLVGLPWIPVTPLFPLCGLAGALPLPTKWRMHFCEPIAAPVRDGRSEEELVADTTARLHAAITLAVGDLLAKRQGIFV